MFEPPSSSKPKSSSSSSSSTLPPAMPRRISSPIRQQKKPRVVVAFDDVAFVESTENAADFPNLGQNSDDNDNYNDNPAAADEAAEDDDVSTSSNSSSTTTTTHHQSAAAEEEENKEQNNGQRHDRKVSVAKFQQQEIVVPEDPLTTTSSTSNSSTAQQPALSSSTTAPQSSSATPSSTHTPKPKATKPTTSILKSTARVPVELQRVFLASARGEEVKEAPKNGSAFKVFMQRWRKRPSRTATISNSKPKPRRSRVPSDLQAVFVAAGQGEEVKEAPKTGVSHNVFFNPIRTLRFGKDETRVFDKTRPPASSSSDELKIEDEEDEKENRIRSSASFPGAKKPKRKIRMVAFNRWAGGSSSTKPSRRSSRSSMSPAMPKRRSDAAATMPPRRPVRQE